jgi:SpoVK/Ycf46/Vps4 family AAA+-type ATPase
MVILLCGGKGTGKTTKVKELLKEANLPAFIYDVNNEYSEAPLPDIQSFLDQAVKKKNCAIVFEEATIFFSSKGRSEELLNILVRSRHNKTFCILVFHSLRSIPVYILELSNYLILKYTADNKTAVEAKYKDFPELINIFEEVQIQSESNFHYSEILNLL